MSQNHLALKLKSMLGFAKQNVVVLTLVGLVCATGLVAVNAALKTRIANAGDEHFRQVVNGLKLDFSYSDDFLKSCYIPKSQIAAEAKIPLMRVNDYLTDLYRAKINWWQAPESYAQKYRGDYVPEALTGATFTDADGPRIEPYSKSNLDPFYVERVYLLSTQKQIQGYAFVVGTNVGYNGYIQSLVVTNPKGTIEAVRVLEQKETPGLGNKITTTNWVDGFTGKTITDAQAYTFNVKKDGGTIDQFTGATITPRAVTGSIKHLMQELVYPIVISKPGSFLGENFVPCP